MGVFKDEELACEILSGKHREKNAARRSMTLAFATMAVLGLAAFAVVYAKNKPALAPVSKTVPVAAAVPEAPPAKPLAPVVAKPKEPIKVDTEMIVLPPVILGEKAAAAPAEKRPAVETKRPITPLGTDARPALPAVVAAKAKLRSGDATAALELLKKASIPAADANEKMEFAVLEARAFLKLGKLAEAKAKLEPYAFADATTEAGTDALMGNFWAQAETMTRCRESELEAVRCGTESWGAAMAALESARRLEAAAKGNIEKLEEARALYQKAIDINRLEEQEESDCMDRLIEITNRVILDPKTACSTPKAIFHKVEPGDVVERIAKKYKVNQGQIKKLNRLNDKLTVRYDQVLKILPGDVIYKVDRSRLLGTLYIGGVFIRRYHVGIGPGDATPLGTYTIENKLMNPDWYYDGKKVPFGDPANILGTRWMGFAGRDNAGMGAGLGVHGTGVPESVPGRESKGCVRMLNPDVEELYDFMPQGGVVEIAE